jgi:hypothetical protein
MSFDGQARQVGGDFLFAHLLGVPFFMEKNEAADPIDIGFLGAQAVMLDAQMPAHAVEQFRGDGGRRWGSNHGGRPAIMVERAGSSSRKSEEAEAGSVA